MISATSATQHSNFDWGALWAILGGLGGAATVATLLVTYLPNLLIPFKITSARYQVGSDNTMTITITVKNRHRDERSLTALVIGQPPNRWKRLRPKWWMGRIGEKLYSIDVNELGKIGAGNSKSFEFVSLTREENTPVSDSLPSNARILAYCGAGRPYVRRPNKTDDLPSTPPPSQ